MPNTYVDYTGDNTTTSFAFPFPYLDDTHVVVQLDTVALAGGKFVDQTVYYSLHNPNFSFCCYNICYCSSNWRQDKDQKR